MRRHLFGVLLALVAGAVPVACASKPLSSGAGGQDSAPGGEPPGAEAGSGGSASSSGGFSASSGSTGRAGSTGSAGSSGHAGSSGSAGAANTPCVRGMERCDCRLDKSCNAGLVCLSNLCVDQSSYCPYVGDGYCDEPNFCPEGTDSDCCATPGDTVCEEVSLGGDCPDGTDWFDCGYCPDNRNGDGFCDEPNICPPGTDDDCCATWADGTCEEAAMGGACDDGTDWFDCGYCPAEFTNDHFCDEPDLCPQGSDAADCCSHFADGTCEEQGKGGECAVDTDWYDCGYCRSDWLDDGFCDEVHQGGSCPSNSDPGDCCAKWGDGICEEPSADGQCPELSDYFDCGYCPARWTEDG